MPDSFDLGELIELKSKFSLKDVRSCRIHSSIKYVKSTARALSYSAYTGKGQRFVIYVKLSKKEEKNAFRGIFFYPSAPSDASPKSIDAIEKITGIKPIQAQKDMTGIVHQEGKQRAKSEAKWSDADEEDVYELGLSLILGKDKISVLNRSTMQYSVQDINENAKYSYFYEPVKLRGEAGIDAASIIFNPVTKEFTNKTYTKYFRIERSTVNEVTQIIMKKIKQYFPKYHIYQDESTANDWFNKEWKKDRYNKKSFSKNVLRTVFIACGFSGEEDKPFWPKITDKEIVSNSIRVLKRKKVKFDVDAFPDEFKDDKRFPELQGVTALMLAAKKECKKSYDLVLMSVNMEENIDIQTIKAFLQENAAMKRKPILIKQNDEFFLYGLSETGE